MPVYDESMIAGPRFTPPPGTQPPPAQDPQAVLEFMRRMGQAVGRVAGQAADGQALNPQMAPAAQGQALPPPPPRLLGNPVPVQAAKPDGFQTGEQILARQGMPSPIGAAMPAMPPPSPPPQLLGANGPGSQLDLMARQPAYEFNGTTAISRTIDKPALAALMAGQSVAPGTMVYSETATPMDPGSIARRIAGQLAPTQEQRALAERLFNEYQQGAAGVMGEQARRELGLGDLALRRQAELVNGVPTALAVAQHGAQADQVKTIMGAYMATLPRDANGNVVATPETVAAAIQLAQSELQKRGLGSVVGGALPSAPPPPQLLGNGPPGSANQGSGGGRAPEDPDEQAKAVLNKQSGNVGEGPLRRVNQKAVDMVLGEKDDKGNWKYGAEPVALLARLKQVMPAEEYANNAEAIKSFLAAHYDPDTLAQFARPGAGAYLNLPGDLGRTIAMPFTLPFGNTRSIDMPDQELWARAFGIAPAYQQGRADLRQLYPLSK